MKINILGNSFMLLPEKGVLWEEKNYLIISDLHLGKSSFFRLRGIAAPGGSDEADLLRLSSIIDQLNPGAVIILGDLIHASCPDIPSILHDFDDSVRGKEIILVQGNHDKSLKNHGYVLEKAFTEGDFIFVHHHFEDEKKYVFAGHIHPSVLLTGEGKSSEKIPCFYFGRKYALLPSFGSFTGNYLINPAEGERVFVAADGEVIEVLRRNKKTGTNPV